MLLSPKAKINTLNPENLQDKIKGIVSRPCLDSVGEAVPGSFLVLFFYFPTDLLWPSFLDLLVAKLWVTV